MHKSTKIPYQFSHSISQIFIAEAVFAIIFVGNVRYDPGIVRTGTRESNCHEASNGDSGHTLAQRGCDSSSALVTALVNFAATREETVFFVGDLVSQMARESALDSHKSLARLLAKQLSTSLYVVPGTYDTELLECEQLYDLFGQFGLKSNVHRNDCDMFA